MVDAKVSGSWDQVKDAGGSLFRAFLKQYPDHMKLFANVGSLDDPEVKRQGDLILTRLGEVVTGKVAIADWCAKMANEHKIKGASTSHFEDLGGVLVDFLTNAGLAADVVEAWKATYGALISEISKGL